MNLNRPQYKPAPPALFDSALVQRRAMHMALADLPFCSDMAEEIRLRLHPVKRDFKTALLLYPPCPLEDALKASGKVKNVDILPLADIPRDPDHLPLPPQSHDLIISCLGLQFASDLPGALVQLRRALKPGGMLLGCLAGGQTLHELRTAFADAETALTGGLTPRVHPGIDIKQMGALLQRTKFIEPIVDIEKYDFAYASVYDLLYDLRKWGGNLMAERRRYFTRGGLFKKMEAVYADSFGTGDHIPATFELIWFSAWAA